MLMVVSLGARLRALLSRLDGDVQAAYDGAGLGFKPRYYPIVRHLLDRGPATVTELARSVGVSQPAATQTIGELVAQGLVETSRGPDGRERVISLAGPGIELCSRLQPIWKAVERAANELDGELPHPLSETLRLALDALERRPFLERIHGNI